MRRLRPSAGRRSGGRLAAVGLALIVGAALGGPVAAALPKFTGHVVDEAGAVPDATEREVNAALADYQRRSGNQIAVAVVGTTARQSIEDYANDLFNEWGVGEEGDDNGVLLVIAVEDRRLRIEVGDGLGGDLTDLEAADIVRDELTPRLQASGGDIGEAVRFGAESIRRALGDDQVGPAPPQVQVPSQPDGGPGADLVGLLLFGAVGAALLGGFGRRRGWGPLSGGGGVWYGGGTWGGGGFGGGGFGGGGGGFGGGGGHSSGGGASGGW